MSPKVEELLLRWEDGRQNGHPVSVDTLCRNYPNLRDELLAQIAALEKMNRVLDLSDNDSPAKTERRQTRYDELRPGWEPIAGYHLETRLGQGGYGEVWKAVGPGGFAVALKFVPLRSQLGANELRSLDVIKTLRHPNLLSIFGAWQVHGFLIIAMEMADRTLLDRLNEAIEKAATGIPQVELINYMEDAAKGIDYLNQPDANLGDSAKDAIQHRDIKPQNIFLMGGGVKIGDFGLLRILKKTVTEHTGSLTLSYAAPEFFQGHTSRWSDQYSLAATYCQLRGGRLPFAGKPGEIMQGHIHGTPDLTMLPESERPIVMRALAKKPDERWPTCSAFVEALRQSGTQAPRPLNWRKSGVLSCVALVVLGVTILASYWWLGQGQTNDPITQGPAQDDVGDGKSGASKDQSDKSDGSAKKDIKPDPFGHLVLNNATRIDDFVRLAPESWIGTKESYSGSIEVTVIARTQMNNIRLNAFDKAGVIFNWERNRNQLRVTRPDGTHKEASFRPLDSNQWYTLRWRVSDRGTSIFVDGKQAFSENHKNKLLPAGPIKVISRESTIAVKSLTVTRLGAKE